jgi:hypothetical protein
LDAVHRSRTRRPDFAPSSETPGGYVGQAVLVLDVLVGRGSRARQAAGAFCLQRLARLTIEAARPSRGCDVANGTGASLLKSHAGAIRDFKTNKLQTRIEDEDDDEYER